MERFVEVLPDVFNNIRMTLELQGGLKNPYRSFTFFDTAPIKRNRYFSEMPLRTRTTWLQVLDQKCWVWRIFFALSSCGRSLGKFWGATFTICCKDWKFWVEFAARWRYPNVLPRCNESICKRMLWTTTQPIDGNYSCIAEYTTSKNVSTSCYIIHTDLSENFADRVARFLSWSTTMWNVSKPVLWKMLMIQNLTGFMWFQDLSQCFISNFLSWCQTARVRIFFRCRLFKWFMQLECASLFSN